MSNEYILICVLLFIGWSILMCYAGWNGRRADIERLKDENMRLTERIEVLKGVMGYE